jgi:hypothetical protein
MDLCMMTRPTLDERYRAAVHSGNMTSDPNTTRSDSDVVGAFGIADRHLTRGSDARGNHFPPAPLAVALARLFAGDNTAGHAIVETMAANLWRQARRQDVKMARVQSEDISRAVLAWFRDGTCKPCGGHGYELAPGAPTLSERECAACGGTGKRHLEREFLREHRELARWLVVEMERELGRAVPAAMAALAPRLDL